MSTILAFVNQKGGVGKTTSVVNVGAALAKSSKVLRNQKRVLVVDMDPQSNLSQVYSSTTDNDPSIYNLLVQYTQTATGQAPFQIQDLTQQTYVEGLDILPSNVLLSSAELELVNAHGRETILKRIFKDNEAFTQQYDYILIDCQPSLGLLTINSIIASDYVVVPLKADVFSLKGLELLNDTIKTLQRVFEIDTTILGLFFTHVGESEAMFKESYKLCKENYGNLLFESVVHRNVVFDQSNAMDQSVLDFDATSSGAKDYRELAEELIKASA